MRKNFIPPAKERIEHMLKENAIVTTGMVKLEILGGTKTEKEFRRLKSRLDALDIVETDAYLWEKAYELAFKLRRKKVTVPCTNILIAAAAQKVGAIVVHADVHFDLISKEVGLKVESFVHKFR